LPDLLSQIPSQLRRELTQQAMDKLRNSSAEEKQRLLEQLNGSVPENAGSVLSNFFRNATETGSSGGQGLNSTTAPSAQLGRTETTLLNEIAGIYSQRNDIAANTRKYIAGVPSSVQRRVLEDWHADAMGLNADPDPVTDINTRLDERIVRQLARARISIDQLDRDLRTRLSDVIGGYERN
jgi:hypothetical protein